MICVQDKIDGFDYYDSEGERIPNHKKMDANNMTVEYQDGILRISDGTTTNEFMVDEHQLIYVNGEEVFELSKIPTNEEYRRMEEDFHESMQADRLRSDRAAQKSIEAAKTFWVK